VRLFRGAGWQKPVAPSGIERPPGLGLPPARSKRICPHCGFIFGDIENHTNCGCFGRVLAERDGYRDRCLDLRRYDAEAAGISVEAALDEERRWHAAHIVRTRP
jgi:hypothetical protein